MLVNLKRPWLHELFFKCDSEIGYIRADAENIVQTVLCSPLGGTAAAR